MAKRWVGGITDAGNELIAKSLGGEAISLYAASFGTGTVAEDELLQQTALVEEKQEASIVANDTVDNGRRIGVEVRGHTETYLANQVAFWAWGADEGARVLLAIFQHEDGIEIPNAEEVPDFLYTFFAVVAVKNDVNIEVKIDPNTSVSREVLEKALEEFKGEVSQMIDEQIDARANGHFTIQAHMDDWSLGEDEVYTQTISDANLLADARYIYIIGLDGANQAGYEGGALWADAITENGKIKLATKDEQKADLTLNVIRIETDDPGGEESASKVISTIGGGGALPIPAQLLITTPPTKKEYFVNDTFDPEGMVVEVVFSGGTQVQVEAYQVSPSGPLPEGTEYVTVSYTENDKTVSAQQPITVKRESFEIPKQNGILTYNKNAQQPRWDNYLPEKMSMSGDMSKIDAGTYHATFTLLDGDRYQWSDGQTGPKFVEWSIGKAMGTISTKPTTVNIGIEQLQQTVTITKTGDGTVTAVADDATVAGVTLAGDIITVKAVAAAGGGYKAGNTTIRVKMADSVNYTGASADVSVVADYTPPLRVFGVCWNYGASATALTRLTASSDPNHLVTHSVSSEPVAAVGNTGGSSPFDAYLPWSGMEEYNITAAGVKTKSGTSGFSRTNNDTLVYIPEFGYAVKDNASGKKRYFYVASRPDTNLPKHPGSNCYVGKYTTGSGYVSKSNLAPLVNITRKAARDNSVKKGTGWQQYDYAAWSAICLLYLVEYADWNCQSKVGRGYCDSNSAAIKSGGTDAMAFHTGRPSGTDGKTAVQYRHIENLWGNVFQWVDGVNFSNGDVYVCLDHTKFADDTTTNYTKAGTKSQSDGYISALGMSTNMPWTFFPSANNGSETTYIPDYAWYSSGWRVLLVGGHWGHGSYCGLWYFSADSGSSNSYSGIGARLLYRP